MTVFKTYLRVILKNLPTIILYTAILIVFAVVNVQSSDNIQTFENTKPRILIINNDSGSQLSENLVKYLEENSEPKSGYQTDEQIKDALFYREISYIIDIPKNYEKDVKDGKNPEISVESTGSYDSALAEMMLKRYVCIQNIYAREVNDTAELIKKINTYVNDTSEVEILSKLDTSALGSQAVYFNFASYSIMACVVFIVCLVLSSFNSANVRRRTIISSLKYKKYNLILMLSSGLYAIAVWVFFVLVGFVLLGEGLLSERGMLFIINSFVFTICVLALAYMLSTILHEKNAVTSIVNIIALGSSFLSGVFVSASFLPDWVLKIAHVFPTYWYVNSNDIIKETENLTMTSLTPVVINMIVMLGFTVVFTVAALIISDKKRKSA